jgi:hypothetical protein
VASRYRTYNISARTTQKTFPSQVKVILDRRSVAQSVLVSNIQWGLKMRFLSVSWWFVDVGRPLSREDEPVFYNVQRIIYIYITHVNTWMYIHNIYKASVQAQYRSCPIFSSLRLWISPIHYTEFCRIQILLLLHHVAIARTTSKTPFPRIPGVFTSPLPSNGCPIVGWNVFTQPLPSNKWVYMSIETSESIHT